MPIPYPRREFINEEENEDKADTGASKVSAPKVSSKTSWIISDDIIMFEYMKHILREMATQSRKGEIFTECDCSALDIYLYCMIVFPIIGWGKPRHTVIAQPATTQESSSTTSHNNKQWNGFFRVPGKSESVKCSKLLLLAFRWEGNSVRN